MPQDVSLNGTRRKDEPASLLYARSYLQVGKHRLQEGLPVVAMEALYQALLFGMRYFVTQSEHRKDVDLTNNEDCWDYAALYHSLTKAGLFDDPYAFNHLSLTVERALWQESFSFSAEAVLAQVEHMLTQLGVLPFDALALPHT